MESRATYPILDKRNVSSIRSVEGLTTSKVVCRFLVRGSSLAASNRKIGASASLPVVDNRIPKISAEDDFSYWQTRVIYSHCQQGAC